MTLCKICEKEQANQTGAHVFPAWMIASAFDKKSRKRDYEVMHSFSKPFNDLPYFGRSVNTETILSNLGRDLTDEEVNSQETPLIVDNLWCRKCEKKLKIVEDYFLDNIDRQLKEYSSIKGFGIKAFEVNAYLIRLFFFSIIYRAFVVKALGLDLNEKESNRLKYFLNTFIKEDLTSTISNLESSKKKDELLDYPLKCIKIETETTTTNPVYINPVHNRPYCLIINKYIIQFYTKESHLRSTPLDFFGITEIL